MGGCGGEVLLMVVGIDDGDGVAEEQSGCCGDERQFGFESDMLQFAQLYDVIRLVGFRGS